MSGFEKEQLEKLKQEQLINSILNRKNFENEAIIQAAKDGKGKSQKEIEERKQQILDSKIREEKQKNEKEIQEKRELLRKVEEEIKKSNEEEKIQEQKRAEQVEKIMRELRQAQEEKNKKEIKEKIEKHEREAFRKKYSELLRKKLSIVQQLDIEKRKEEKKKNRELQKGNHKISSGIDKKEEKKQEQRTSKNRNILIERNNGIYTVKPKEEKQSKVEKVKRTVSSFKLFQGIKTYEKNMRDYMSFYNRNSVRSSFNKTIGGNQVNRNRAEKEKTFMDSVRAVIDHKKAIENVEKNKKIGARFEPRIH